MIHLSFRRLKPEHRSAVERWLAEVNEQRRDEAIATLIAEGVTHETAAILDTADGPLLVYAMETDDFERARSVGATSSADIDQRHHEVMRAADAGSASSTTVLDLIAPHDADTHNPVTGDGATAGADVGEALALSWDEQIASFWASSDDTRPHEMWDALSGLLAERPHSDPEALFERASLHDFLGEEGAAIPLYRAALDAGLRGARRPQAVIQLASSLRNVGEPDEATRLLQSIQTDDVVGDAARAFLALALHDTGYHAEALRTALDALAPTLSMYRRSVAAYAGELVDTPAPPRIRNIAVGLIVRDDHALVEIYPATERHGVFARAIGGGIDFGETASDAVRREFAEELGVVVTAATPLAITENHFEIGDRRGHEVVHVFAVTSPELDALPLDARLRVLDNHTTVRWMPLPALRAEDPPFYPAGMLDIAESLAIGQNPPV